MIIMTLQHKEKVSALTGDYVQCSTCTEKQKCKVSSFLHSLIIQLSVMLCALIWLFSVSPIMMNKVYQGHCGSNKWLSHSANCSDLTYVTVRLWEDKLKWKDTLVSQQCKVVLPLCVYWMRNKSSRLHAEIHVILLEGHMADFCPYE